MNYKKLLLVIGLFLSINFLYAQESKQQQYLNAKSLYSQESYNLAMEAFKPLMQRSADNPFAEYASFYYALAAYNQGYVPMAKNMMLQIKERFPKWSKINEVKYWLGKIYMETQEYNQAITILDDINDRSFKEDVNNLKFYYLGQIKEVENVKRLYENHKNDKVLGEVLAQKIASQSLVNQDQKLLAELVKKFELNADDYQTIIDEKPVFKDRYKVAVLFPFLMNRLSADEKPKVNQLVLDLYDGIRFALDTLRDQGIKVDVYAYDTERSKASTKKILEKDELKSMDLIIGPLFSGPRALVQEFSFKYKINMINPLSSDADVVGKNPYSFLFNPSNETIGRKTAEYVSKHARNNTGVIIYGETAQDSAVAMSYKQKIQAEGFNIIASKKIEKDDTRQILDMLVNKGKIGGGPEDEAIYRIKEDSVGHIFVASTNELISSKVISAVQTRGDSIMIVGSADWLKMAVVGYDVYEKLGAALFAPLYVNTEKPEFNRFREHYISKHRVVPSQYASIGYEMMLFLGKSLGEYGKYFQTGWDKQEFMPGYLTPGYSYSNTQDNSVVPILNFGPEGVDVIYEVDEKE
ncbi:ABC transporter substrate-binding protein [Fulvivirga sediminis]|uniref:ABC transporter substrate-binding protein n=1 Tax=Fulvivirga sediminis TaxID=2803949 RepID=A0A937F720_9BACT|nr:ABC transporter substrate-binding protein [Fulvivirga sediminis]MBL3655500.1 ABC transporter substrate-binding protein [Fulvivirga sediminis]